MPDGNDIGAGMGVDIAFTLHVFIPDAIGAANHQWVLSKFRHLLEVQHDMAQIFGGEQLIDIYLARHNSLAISTWVVDFIIENNRPISLTWWGQIRSAAGFGRRLHCVQLALTCKEKEDYIHAKG